MEVDAAVEVVPSDGDVVELNHQLAKLFAVIVMIGEAVPRDVVFEKTRVVFALFEPFEFAVCGCSRRSRYSGAF